ncbi:MAG TPA: hypothetical protein VK623_10050 [Flavobacterium sp.]|nr:hypothetical protein [Flavobacterium sp.]
MKNKFFTEKISLPLLFFKELAGFFTYGDPKNRQWLVGKNHQLSLMVFQELVVVGL